MINKRNGDCYLWLRRWSQDWRERWVTSQESVQHWSIPGDGLTPLCLPSHGGTLVTELSQSHSEVWLVGLTNTRLTDCVDCVEGSTAHTLQSHRLHWESLLVVLPARRSRPASYHGRRGREKASWRLQTCTSQLSGGSPLHTLCNLKGMEGTNPVWNMNRRLFLSLPRNISHLSILIGFNYNGNFFIPAYNCTLYINWDHISLYLIKP